MNDYDNNNPDKQHENNPELITDDNHNEIHPPPPVKQSNHVLQVWKGIGLLALLHLLLFVFPVAFFFISIAQLIYLFPVLYFFRNNKGMYQGLLIGAGITFLLNAACFGLLVSGGIRL